MLQISHKSNKYGLFVNSLVVFIRSLMFVCFMYFCANTFSKVHIFVHTEQKDTMRNSHRKNWIKDKRTGKMVKTSKIPLLAFDPTDYDIDGLCGARLIPRDY